MLLYHGVCRSGIDVVVVFYTWLLNWKCVMNDYRHNCMHPNPELSPGIMLSLIS